MPAASSAGVPIHPVGPVSCATVLWRAHGVLRVTAIVKATFAIRQDDAMCPVEPAPIHEAEVHHQDNPARSIVAASDLAPYLPRADVLLTGHARAPRGAAAEVLSVRLVVARDRVLFDKSLQAIGDSSGGRIVPFEQIPLVYERAYGGAGHRDNPLGVGVGSDVRRPSLVDPAQPGRSAGFGPISRTWSARRSMLTPEQRRALELPIAEIPPDLDWSYFQSAPLDQRIEHLSGDELIVLDGVHADLPRLRTKLPGAAAAMRLYGPGEWNGQVVPLLADTLNIDADAERCSVTWRGSLIAPSERELSELRFAAGVSLGREAISWPERLFAAVEVRGGAARGGAAGAARGGGAGAGGTVLLGEGGAKVLGASETLADAPRSEAEPDDLARTHVLTPLDATRPLTAPPAASRDGLPFRASAGTLGAERNAAVPLPGAPWTPGDAAPVPRASPDLRHTVDLGSSAMAPPALVVASAPPFASAPASASMLVSASPASPPTPSRPEPKASLKSELYKKFGKR